MSITTGQTVKYTNRKGTEMTGTVLDVLPAEVFGQELAVVEFIDGPAKGMQKRMKPADLVPAAS